MTITMVFLALGVIGNLGLTLYLQREKQTATLTEAVDKDAKFIDEITRLRSEVAHMKVLVANGQNEIGRMKIAYQTVIGQIGVVQNAPQSRYAPAKSEAAKLNQPDGPDKALEKSSEKVK